MREKIIKKQQICFDEQGNNTFGKIPTEGSMTCYWVTIIELRDQQTGRLESYDIIRINSLL